MCWWWSCLHLQRFPIHHGNIYYIRAFSHISVVGLPLGTLFCALIIRSAQFSSFPIQYIQITNQACKYIIIINIIIILE